MGNISGAWGRSRESRNPRGSSARVPMNPEGIQDESSENPTNDAQSSVTRRGGNQNIRLVPLLPANPSETINLAVSRSAEVNASTPSLTEASEDDGQLCRGLSPSNPLSVRLSLLRKVASKISICTLATHRKIWSLIEDLTNEDASTESRETCFIYLVAVAALSSLTLDDIDTLVSLLTKPVAPPLLSKPIAALEVLLDHKKHAEALRHGFTAFMLQSLRFQFDFVAKSRKILRGRRSEAHMAEVDGLNALLAFIMHTTYAGIEFLSEGLIPDLVGELLYVGSSTTTERDLKGVLRILAKMIELRQIPPALWKSCMEMFCGVMSLKDDISVIGHACLTQLLQGDDSAIGILVGVIDGAPPGRDKKSVRGALKMLTSLFLKRDHSNSPSVSFSQLVHSIERVYLVGEHYQRDLLETVQALLCEADVRKRVLTEDWGTLFKILNGAIAKSPQDASQDTKRDSLHSTTLSSLSLSLSDHSGLDKSDEYREQQLKAVLQIADALESVYQEVNLGKQELICIFYQMAGLPLPEAILGDLIKEFLAYVPLGAGNTQPKLLAKLLSDGLQDSEKRALLLERLRDAIPDRPSTSQQGQLRRLVSDLISKLPQEQNVRLVNAIAALAATHARMAELREIDSIVQSLIAFVDLEGTSRAASHSTKIEQPSNTVTSSLVGLFLYYMTRSAEKAVLLYDALVDLIDNTEHPPSARLTAMKLLTRLRSTASSPALAVSASNIPTSSLEPDTSSSSAVMGASASYSNAIMVVAVPDSLGLAAFLCRTEDSAFSTTFNFNSTDVEAVVEQPQSRAGRTSTMSSPGASRPKTRSTSGQSRGGRPTPPLWMYPGRRGLPEDPPKTPSKVLRLCAPGTDPKTTLQINTWLEATIKILQQPGDWEVYSYTLVHLPSQLSNPQLFSHSIPQIRHLRSAIVDQLLGDKFLEPPPKSGAKKGDVALCLIHSLIMLVAYSEYFSRNEQDMIVKTFLFELGQFDRVAKTCIQALTVCCHELPRSVNGSLGTILAKMAQIITKAHLAMDILEFLGGLAGLPRVYADLSEYEFRAVFGICIKHLEHSREQRENLNRNSTIRQSGISSGSDSTQNVDVHKDLPQYIYALAHHVITFWFLSLKLVDRPQHVGWITSRLSSMDSYGNNIMEEQSQVTLDMMHRTTYLDLGETKADPQFTPSDGRVLQKSWIVGLSIMTIETAVGTGRTQITKRQASGTTYASYIPHTAPLPPHHVPMAPDAMSGIYGREARVNVFPSHIFMQLSSTIAPTPTPMEPICLPDNEMVQRAISAFDRNDTVDGHKAGVIYVGNSQTSEAEILANTAHSPAFTALLEGLGTKVPLKGAKFNTQGLDRESNSDGDFTYAWRNRVVEMVYHVPSMMPTNEEYDPQCVLKKRHIGNDYVNIVYNDSGLPFDFNTFPSQFNQVNIVVTPDGLFAPEPKPDAKLETIPESSRSSSASSKTKRHSRHGSTNTTSPTKKTTSSPAQISPTSYPAPTSSPAPNLPKTFRVQTLVHPAFPPISPAHTSKSISLSSLGPVVRQIALNASVFCQAWSTREGGEHISSWRNRLREIYRLRERHTQSGNISAGMRVERNERAAAGRAGDDRDSAFGSTTRDRRLITRESQFQGIRAERSYADGDAFVGLVGMGGLAEQEGIQAGLDFSRWAGDNPKLGHEDRT